jgi:competence protein ComEA
MSSFPLNRHERAVVVLLLVAFLAGAGILQYRRARLARRVARSPVVVVNASRPGSLRDSAAVVGPLDINQAARRQLEGLPGIGPVLAGRIIEYRQRRGGFRSVDELRAVSGIGPKRLADIRDLVVVRESDATVTPDSGR